ncbi:hypothetical protein PoB_004646200 [Plakobranchus ocellatus]|uniref:Uncharacterized protein n=1 Tax=Plakobranchus ocellatus TaxID=259542 RepID=A0AAV4BKX1_9GAST|nr:hypothetical protein PoB_004646200 [Plakobranchus ocellatus]
MVFIVVEDGGSFIPLQKLSMRYYPGQSDRSRVSSEARFVPHQSPGGSIFPPIRAPEVRSVPPSELRRFDLSPHQSPGGSICLPIRAPEVRSVPPSEPRRFDLSPHQSSGGLDNIVQKNAPQERFPQLLQRD